ncbi:hypothetical protein [Alienimonas californiensis]|uniref:Uncharacterized protein n=1 Tax=Alienimonas californiensis TaxID=2527989 RepID=A0A517PBU3_9PLAN|nr:hypothetical protein [Alienimonas californiensis]QDT16847.1 hypothetical protein CA12_29550 [Alienimonas californiensis]
MSDPIGDKQAYNDLNMRSIFLIGLLSAVALFVIITGARVLFQKWQAGEYQQKQIDIPLASVDAELQEQRAAIDRYGWNPTTNAAAIPVDVAMTELVEEMSADGAADGAAAVPDSLPTVPKTGSEPRAGTGAAVPDDAATGEESEGDDTESTDEGAEA